ncbi:hypothetical protein LCGC14_2268350 [marine sediment metagenome]|uniref:Uncharacterized protein n=1 Tax=marine sediment metagenome TaxID=412755 RepID=A0A0F9CXW6_9ZZZZ
MIGKEYNIKNLNKFQQEKLKEEKFYEFQLTQMTFNIIKEIFYFIF